MFTVLAGYVVLFACFVARIRVEVDVDAYTPPPPLHSRFFSLPTIFSLTQVTVV